MRHSSSSSRHVQPGHDTFLPATNTVRRRVKRIPNLVVVELNVQVKIECAYLYLHPVLAVATALSSSSLGHHCIILAPDDLDVWMASNALPRWVRVRARGDAEQRGLVDLDEEHVARSAAALLFVDVPVRVLGARPVPEAALQLLARDTLETRAVLDKDPVHLVGDVGRVRLRNALPRPLLRGGLDDLPGRVELRLVAGPVDDPAPFRVAWVAEQPLDLALGGEVVPFHANRGRRVLVAGLV